MTGFILHLQGPMMSFADTGFGQLREQGEAPSRSAVIGVIAAAMGLERGAARLVELHDKLRVHTAAVRSGPILTDYHTILTDGYQDHDPVRLRREGADGNPTLTWRSYHLDAHFVVFVESDDPSILDECRTALESPVFVSYLGRRCCPPAMPLLPKAMEAANPLDALCEAVSDSWEERRKLRGGTVSTTNFPAWLDGTNVPESASYRVTTVARGWRRDLLVAVPRYYVSRPVMHINVELPQGLPPSTNREYFDAVS